MTLSLALLGAARNPDVLEEPSEYHQLLGVPPGGKGRSYLKKEEALQDFAILEKVLREGYSGWEAALEYDRFSWERFFTETKARIEAEERWSTKDLLSLFVTGLSRVRDRHLGFLQATGGRVEWHPVYAGTSYRFSDLLLEGEPREGLRILEASPGTKNLIGGWVVPPTETLSSQRLFRTLPGPGGEPRFLLGAEKDDRIRISVRMQNGETWVEELPLHENRFRLRNSRNRTFRLTRIPFPRLEIGSFSTLEGDRLEAFLASAFDLRGEETIVLDLRGNGGGSDRFTKEWLQNLTGEVPASWSIRELISPVTLQGDVLLHRWLLRQARDSFGREQAGGRLAYSQQRLAEAADQGISRHWVESDSGTSWGSAPPLLGSSGRDSPGRPLAGREAAFRGRLVIFMDRNTASSAETFVLMAKKVPGTILVGENTSGMARFGEIKLYRLPHSGLEAQIGSRLFEDPEGCFEEGTGFIPDYWVDSSQPISGIPELSKGAPTGASSTASSGID